MVLLLKNISIFFSHYKIIAWKSLAAVILLDNLFVKIYNMNVDSYEYEFIFANSPELWLIAGSARIYRRLLALWIAGKRGEI